MRFLPFLAVFLIACPTTSEDPDPPPAEESVVTFATSDGETLEADWYPADDVSSGAVLLFHMIPPGNDRTGYPVRVREALHDQGVSVLNVDRRGAGGSTGTPTAAYEGEGGRLDVQAAVTYALDQGADADKLVLVGASNGTTSVYDYVVGRDDGFGQAAAVVFMSPGTYTENQNDFVPQQDAWEVSLSFPFLWLYPMTEPYSQAFVPDAPGAWKFVEDGNQHGTNMFDEGSLEETMLSELTTWVAAVQ
ncbi:MAG: alpha/beta fold hydrolase [Proteobacteria bacterium]|nr:alpha/beta fold hydrolase [Pseudomonadota bacterium]